METPEKPAEEFENIFEQWMYVYFKENNEKFKTAAELLKKYSGNPMYSEKNLLKSFRYFESERCGRSGKGKGIGKLMCQ